MDFAVVGDPVSHSRSPEMHSAAYAERGLALTYGRVQVPAGTLADTITRLKEEGVRGLNVTVPLKEEAAALAGFEPDALVQELGSANTLDLINHRSTNTDAPGMLLALERRAVKPGAHIVLLGAGGTARALLPTLEKAGYRISIWNRTEARAQHLVETSKGGARVLSTIEVRDANVLLNATSGSLTGAALPIPWHEAPPHLEVIDLFYSEHPTRFLEEAQQHGLNTSDGRELLAAQGAIAFAWWLGGEPPLEIMRRSLNL